MQPQNNPQAGFNLPPVAPEQLPPVPAEAAPGMPEMAPSAPEIAPNPGAAMPQMAPPILPQTSPLQVPQSIPPVVPATTATAALPTTQDADLIEKEWVHKAKQIVEKTKEDPHQQSKQLSGLKADYLQKRYSKEIKQGE